MAAPKNFSTVILSAGAVDLLSDWIDVSGCGMLTLSVLANYSAATLAGVLRIRGTNNLIPGAAEPILTNAATLAALPANVTNVATGLTFASPAGTSAAVLLALPTFPQKIQLDWDYTSGGGTVSLIVTAAGWTV